MYIYCPSILGKKKYRGSGTLFADDVALVGENRVQVNRKALNAPRLATGRTDRSGKTVYMEIRGE